MSEQLEAWRQFVNRAFLPIAITAADRDAFAARASKLDIAGVPVWRLSATPMTAVRTVRHIAASNTDDYLLAMHTHGTAIAEQHGRTAVLAPGDFTLVDSTRPYQVDFVADASFGHVIFQIPRSVLAGHRRVDDLTAVPVRADSGPGRLVSPFLATLAASPLATGFVEAGVDLALTALRHVVGAPHMERRASVALAGLRHYVLTHLTEPGLTAEQVAAANFMSVRQLHRLFATEDHSFGAWLREQRLRRCHADLADPGLAHLTIGEIAFRAGFRSPAHFSRAFAARYGVTPSEHRHGA